MLQSQVDDALVQLVHGRTDLPLSIGVQNCTPKHIPTRDATRRLATTRFNRSSGHFFWQDVANASSSPKICMRVKWVSSAMIRVVRLTCASNRKAFQRLNRLAQISILQALASSAEALMAQLVNTARNGTAAPRPAPRSSRTRKPQRKATLDHLAARQRGPARRAAGRCSVKRLAGGHMVDQLDGASTGREGKLAISAAANRSNILSHVRTAPPLNVEIAYALCSSLQPGDPRCRPLRI
jgi:hypothetical protein